MTKHKILQKITTGITLYKKEGTNKHSFKDIQVYFDFRVRARSPVPR